jgi:hypothetical protein
MQVSRILPIKLKGYVGGEFSLNAITTGGNGDLWNFINTTNLTRLDSVNGRVRLYHILNGDL